MSRRRRNAGLVAGAGFGGRGSGGRHRGRRLGRRIGRRELRLRLLAHLAVGREKAAIHDLDRFLAFGHKSPRVSVFYVNAGRLRAWKIRIAAGALVALMERLRSECPWDRKQTARDLAGYLLEECYEVLEALSREDWRELEGELGDLLFQIVFLAKLGQERGAFDFASVARRIHDKMVARHPHVFGEAAVQGRRRRPRAVGGAQAQGAREGGSPALAVRRRPAGASGAPEGRAPDVARRGPRLRLGARRGRPRQAGRGGRRVQGRAAVAGRRAKRARGGRDRRPPLHRRQRRPPPSASIPRPRSRARTTSSGGASRKWRGGRRRPGKTSRRLPSRSSTLCGMK